MSIIESRLTSQGQISVPVEIRKKLGLSPGSIIEWYEKDGEIVVRRAAKYTSQDIHKAVFSTTPKLKLDRELKKGIARYMRRKHEGN